ncbi:MAG: DUF5309 family protein [Nocardioides sp.]|uniref:SU10 major capsid protein n=1 Tax=Nocardioides sp. TaxID=35761 RepID=UPI0039E509F1
MAGAITGIGTTFNLPNYHGELFALSPTETPFLSAIGGLTSGGQSDDYEAEWQTYDLRDPSDRQRTEGADAPTAEERVRGNVRNVAEIHQEKVSVSYTKQAAIGRYATPQAAPFGSGSGGANPVTSELDWQVVQAIKQVALDVNYSFINGEYNLPTDNSTARKTRGLLSAITTNSVNKGTAVTDITTATDTFTKASHGLSDGDKIVFTAVGAMSGIVKGRVYYVVNSSTTFKVAATSGGSAITVGTASGVALIKLWSTTLAVETHLNPFFRGIYDNGGLRGPVVLLANSGQKMAISAAYANAYAKADPLVRGERIGGVAVDTIVTDFGTFGIMLEPNMPQDAIAAVSMEECMPFFLNVPGKGVFFEEALAKAGAAEERQIYGEIGLKYGAERHHGVLRGLAA